MCCGKKSSALACVSDRCARIEEGNVYLFFLRTHSTFDKPKRETMVVVASPLKRTNRPLFSLPSMSKHCGRCEICEWRWQTLNTNNNECKIRVIETYGWSDTQSHRFASHMTRTCCGVVTFARHNRSHYCIIHMQKWIVIVVLFSMDMKISLYAHNLFGQMHLTLLSNHINIKILSASLR